MRRRLSRAAKKNLTQRPNWDFPIPIRPRQLYLAACTTESLRGYQHSINEFINWYCPNLACPSTRPSSPGTESTSRVVH